MVVKFYLSKDKRASEPQKGCLVICSVSWYGHRLKRSTGENCPEKEWLGNKGNGFVSKKVPYYYAINERLSKQKSAIEHFLQNAITAGKLPTKEELSQYYDTLLPAKSVEVKPEVPTEVPKLLTLTEAVYQYQCYKSGTNDKEEHKKMAYIRAFNQTVGWLKEYGNEAILVKDVNATFLSEFVNYMLDNELEHNTVQGRVKHIKTVLGYCMINLKEQVDVSYREFKINYIEPDIVFLLPSEITALASLKFGDDAEEQELERARDFFLFGCYVGARYADLARFDKTNILEVSQGKYLSYRPEKTPNVKVSLYLVPPAVAILDKYVNEKKLLPKFENSEINELIKPIAKRAGIVSKTAHTIFAKKRRTEVFEKWEHLTMHSARHTFATICFLSGMSEVTVQRFLGHSKITTTKRYIHLAEAFKTESIKNAWAFGEVE